MIIIECSYYNYDNQYYASSNATGELKGVIFTIPQFQLGLFHAMLCSVLQYS